MEFILFLTLIIAIFLYILAGIFVLNHLTQWKGIFGERTVARKLSKLDKNNYKILHDLLLPSINGNFSQIDHVIISRFGIFCIETKAHVGIISGNIHEKEWMQTIYQKQTKFYNPLWQNNSHVRTIKNIISAQYPKVLIIPIIVFTKAKRVYAQGTTSLCNTDDLIQKIESYTNIIYDESVCNEIYAILSQAHVYDKRLREVHVQRVSNFKKA